MLAVLDVQTSNINIRGSQILEPHKKTVLDLTVHSFFHSVVISDLVLLIPLSSQKEKKYSGVQKTFIKCIRRESSSDGLCRKKLIIIQQRPRHRLKQQIIGL